MTVKQENELWEMWMGRTGGRKRGQNRSKKYAQQRAENPKRNDTGRTKFQG